MNLNFQPIHIAASGHYLPKRVVTADEMDERLELAQGSSYKMSGVARRRVAVDETVSQMGANAARAALEKCGLEVSDLDAIIFAGVTFEQPLPCTAVFIQKELGAGDSGIPCFDINASCLSFLVAFETTAAALTAGVYNRVLIVSSEMPSTHINYAQPKSAALFGDGAVAFVLEKSDGDHNGSRILASRMETYSSSAESCQMLGGGSRLSPHKYKPERHADYCFNMDGRKVFKHASREFPGFIGRLLEPLKVTMGDFDVVVPHQASRSALNLICKKLEIHSNQVVDVLKDHGNMVAASIPFALHSAIESKKIRKNQTVLLVGTGAGLSFGGIVLKV